MAVLLCFNTKAWPAHSESVSAEGEPPVGAPRDTSLQREPVEPYQHLVPLQGRQPRPGAHVSERGRLGLSMRN